MATLTEKAPAPPQQLHLKTPCVTEKASHDTFGTDTLTPSAEKNGATSMDVRRDSGASRPMSNHLNPFDTDVEAIITQSHSQSDNCTRKSTNMRRGGTDCHVWPGQDHWKRKAKAAKMKRSCRCFSHLSKRNRLIVKILIGFLIVGIAVGVGFGVSKPLGAGIWQPHDTVQTS